MALKVYSTFLGEWWACCLFLSLPYFSRGCLITLSGESGQCSQSPLSSTSVQNLSLLGSSLAVQGSGLHASTAGGTGWITGQSSNIPHDSVAKKPTKESVTFAYFLLGRRTLHSPGGLSPPPAPPQSFEMLLKCSPPQAELWSPRADDLPLQSSPRGGPQVSLTLSAHPSSMVPRPPHLVHP